MCICKLVLFRENEVVKLSVVGKVVSELLFAFQYIDNFVFCHLYFPQNSIHSYLIIIVVFSKPDH